jgi:two-component system NarL family sensor kinase
VFEAPEQLIENLALNTERHALHLWQVWQTRDRVIVGAQPIELVEDASSGLFQVQGNFLNHFFRLLLAERRLSQRVRRGRRGSGRKAIQQMELERRRLGRELHTGAGQMLAAIRLQLELISEALPDPPPDVNDALQRIGLLAADTLEQLRSISKRLHPPEWQRLTLEEAIRQLWQISGIPQRFHATLDLDALPREPELEVKVLLYRAMQEALSNLVRHSQATRVEASLKHRDGVLSLTVHDNGVGFNVARLLRGPVDVAAGIGLRSVTEQAEALGGKMTIESGLSGTTLVVSVAISPVGL